METIYIPDKVTYQEAVRVDDPILLLVAHDETELIVSNIDEAMEHHILLKKAGRPDSSIDKYFRLVVNSRGADWTFACPGDYKGIPDRSRRIKAYYNDGIDSITRALTSLDYAVPVNIPDRYRRHFNELSHD